MNKNYYRSPEAEQFITAKLSCNASK